MGWNSRTLILLLVLLLVLIPLYYVVGGEDKVKVMTYNVLADPVHVRERIPVLLRILEESDADVIALQEVAPWFIDELKKQAWFVGYHTHHQEGKPYAPGGLMILSKQPIERHGAARLPGRQGRAILLVETKIRDIPFRIATCHLESFLEDGPIRARQLDLFFKELDVAENALFLGDFNFGDGEMPETEHLPPDYVDAWLATRKGDPGFTWNIEVSPMAKAGSFKEETSRRIDRILTKSKRLTPVSAKIFGDKPVEGNKDIFPSDHFGLRATFALEEPK